MTKEEIKQMIIEITDRKCNSDNSSLELAASDFTAAIINSFEDIMTEALYQTQENNKSKTVQ